MSESRSLSIDSTVGAAVIHCNPRPYYTDVGHPQGLPTDLRFGYIYEMPLDFGNHCGRSVGCPGGAVTGSTGPLVEVTLPDGTVLVGLLTSHHVVSSKLCRDTSTASICRILTVCVCLSGSREPIHASLGGRGVDRPVVSPSDPDHERWVNHIEEALRRDRCPEILDMKRKPDAGETISRQARSSFKRVEEIQTLEAAMAKAKAFERHLGHVLCTSGLGAAQHVDGHCYAQDWALVIIDSARLKEEQEEQVDVDLLTNKARPPPPPHLLGNVSLPSQRHSKLTYKPITSSFVS